MTVMSVIIAGLLAINAFSTLKISKELQTVQDVIESIEIPEFNLDEILENIPGYGYSYGYNYNNPYSYGNDYDNFFGQFFNDDDEDDYSWYYGDSNTNQNGNQNKPDNNKEQKENDGFSMDDIYDFFSGLFGEDEASQGV